MTVTRTRWLAGAIGAYLLAGCTDAVPSTDEFERGISDGYGHYAFDEPTCQTFPSDQISGSGRASCTGAATLQYAFYQMAEQDDYMSDLAATGTPTKTAPTVWRRDINRQLIKTTTPSGSNVRYSSQCTYRELSKGWNIYCETNIPEPKGQDRSAFPADAIVIGSDEYDQALGQIREKQEQYDAGLAEFKGGIDAFFKSGRTIDIYRYAYRTGEAQKLLTIKLGSDLTWQQAEERFNGLHSYTNADTAFWVQAKFESVEGRNIRGSNQNFCGWRRGEPRDDILFSGEITNGVMREGIQTGQFGARLKIMDRSGDQNNSFRCGIDLYWTGENWVVGWRVNRSKKYLEIVSR